MNKKGTIGDITTSDQQEKSSCNNDKNPTSI